MYLALSEVRTMADRVASHYGENLKLADAIAEKLRSVGKDLNKLAAADLAMVDEFHIRGRKATLELGEKMNLNAGSGRSGTNVGRRIWLPSDWYRFDSGVLRRGNRNVRLGRPRRPGVI
jgi:hypothetical protein